MKNKKYYRDAGISSSWKELREAYELNCNSNEKWIFNGEKIKKEDADSLKSRIEILFEKIPPVEKSNLKSKIKKRGWLKVHYKEWLEMGLLRKFQRQYHHYGKIIPQEEEIVEWFSLMQHYGAPTRLLDWTYSFNVATFFAVENIKSENKGENCQIWAANLDWLEKKLHKQFPTGENIFENKDRNLRKIKNFKIYNRKTTVVTITPYYLNERLAIQQGLFLMPGDVRKSFMENLMGLAKGKKKELENNLIRFQIENTIEAKRDIFSHLHRMNMNRTVLFPGLDGFAKSLENFLFFIPGALDPGERIELI